ncbi:MAG: dihydropteroate synthase [Candidatus Omnitrophica bacterium]|nr:dihydropteroate synthase [Candidatus Omnitrophota bacterium]
MIKSPPQQKTNSRRPARNEFSFKAGKYRLDLGARTYIMGVLNVTPDSFSDGGTFFDKDAAVKGALEMAKDGADIIDIGGESTRPGARAVGAGEEIDRVLPVIAELSKKLGVPISVDTRKARVAEEALKAGAAIVNDVSALGYDPAMGAVVAKYGAGLILMHMKGEPETMQRNPSYGDLMGEIIESLRLSIEKVRRAGVADESIIVDPGIGFGKTVEHNLEILRRLDKLGELGRPVCVGTSRKSFIGKVLSLDDPSARLAGTLATCTVAIMKGARLLRVHDVREVIQVARMTENILRRG